MKHSNFYSFREQLYPPPVKLTLSHLFVLQYAAEEPRDAAPVLAVTDDTELNFITAQRRVAYYMFAANKNHPNSGSPPFQPRSTPPPVPPKIL